MAYSTECVVCDESGSVPERNESIASGSRLYRTQNDEWGELMKEANFAESAEERAKAEKRAEFAPKWDHYCAEHAAAIGIAPAAVAADVVYSCEECGHVDDGHRVVPGDDGMTPACRECGARAIRREKRASEGS